MIVNISSHYQFDDGGPLTDLFFIVVHRLELFFYDSLNIYAPKELC